MNEEFERWYREAYTDSDGIYPALIRDGGGYADPIDHIAFEAWLACSGEILVSLNSDYHCDASRERLRSAVSKDAEKWREHCRKLSEAAMTTPKNKQINIRLTPEQETLLRQYCIRNNLTTQQAVVAALAKVIEGFVGGSEPCS